MFTETQEKNTTSKSLTLFMMDSTNRRRGREQNGYSVLLLQYYLPFRGQEYKISYKNPNTGLGKVFHLPSHLMVICPITLSQWESPTTLVASSTADVFGLAATTEDSGFDKNKLNGMAETTKMYQLLVHTCQLIFNIEATKASFSAR